MGDAWRLDGWPTPLEWQALGAVATAVVAAVAAWIALTQLKNHAKAEVERSRPYVVVDFAFRHYQLLVEISNIGRTPARDLGIQWDPQIRGTQDDRSEALARVFGGDRIPFLAPARSMLIPVGSMPAYLKADLPDRFKVTTNYMSDETGAAYEESVFLDPSHWSEAFVALPYEKRLADEAKKQTRELGRLTAAVNRIVVDRNKDH